VTLSFEDPQRMFTVLSAARRRLMSEVMREPQTIKELTSRLHRNRSAVTKDVGMLEKIGLIVSSRQSNPGHGFQKVVRSIAPKAVLRGPRRPWRAANLANFAPFRFRSALCSP
jgi:predicted transcriptional regulator